jgi:hypothetical protein
MEKVINDETQKRKIILDDIIIHNNYVNEYFCSTFDVIKFMFYEPTKHKYINSIETKNNGENERIIQKMFSKIFIMTSEYNIKKIYQMKDKLLYFNLSFEFFFSENLPELYVKYIEYKNENGNLNFSDWSYLRSLINIFTEIKKKNYKKTIILCDDVLINVNLCDLLKYNKELYTNWDAIIFDDYAFALNINIIDDIIRVIDYIVNNTNQFTFADLFKNVNKKYVKDIFISNIKKENIIEYQNKQEKKFQSEIDNLEKKICNKNITKDENNLMQKKIDYVKSEFRNKRYIFEFNDKLFYISLPYDTLLVNNNKYYEYIQKKKIALIGPSPSIKKNKNGEEINSYDVIVKINNSIFCNDDYDYTGNRLDVLYTLSIAQNLNQIIIDEKYLSFQEYFFHLIEKKKVKFIVFSNELHSNIHNQWLSIAIYKFSEIYNVNKIPIIFMPKNIIDIHLHNAFKIPSAGYGAIVNLLQYDIQKLYIKGFTFFKDGHTASYIGKEWREKMEKKSNTKIKCEIDSNIDPDKKQDLEEKIIHSLVKNNYCNFSPHNFDYEYKTTIQLAKKDLRIMFDEYIKYLYE